MTRPERSAGYSAISLFAGCGGSDLGLAAAGVEVVWANEINLQACTFYKNLTGNQAIECGDVSSVEKFPAADILVGCYPCQGFSQGGRRVAEMDNRNFLYRQFGRALRQIRPLAFVVENVNGMRFSHNNNLFNNQLRFFRSAGYCVSHAVLDAKNFGLAQDRKRIFLVGIRSSEKKRFQFPKPTHGPGAKPFRTLRDVIGEFPAPPAGSFNEEPFHWYYLSRNRRREWHQQSPCVVAHWRHIGLHPDSPALVRLGADHWEFEDQGPARRFSYLECAAIQGFKKLDAFSEGPVSKRFRAIGNAVPPPLFAAVAKALVRQLDS